MKNYRDYGWMFQNYVTEGLTILEISKLAGVNQHTIWENLVRLKIPRRTPGIKNWTYEMRLSIMPKLKGRKPMLGKTHSAETKRQMSKIRSGSGNSNWKGGLTLNSRNFRKSRPYQEWRKAVLERDNRQCQYNGCGCKTSIVHHIKPVKDFPELKLVVDNGMAVCEEHHKQIHKDLRRCAIASSEMYATEAAIERSIVGLKKYIEQAVVVKQF